MGGFLSVFLNRHAFPFHDPLVLISSPLLSYLRLLLPWSSLRPWLSPCKVENKKTERESRERREEREEREEKREKRVSQ